MGISRLLVVDDDRSLTAVLSTALSEEGFEVVLAANGVEALASFEAKPPDLVVLDVLMPEMDGLEVCRRIRRTSRVPIVFLTSRAEEVDRICGLEMGADDYLSKPFSIRELVARIRAIGRRVGEEGPGGEPSDDAVVAGLLRVDPARFRVTWKDQPVELTRSEFLVLKALVVRRGRVLERQQLLELARGDGVVVTDRAVDTFIKRIRQKVRVVDPSFDEVETVVGVGYRYREAER